MSERAMTIDDLAQCEGQAELIGGRLVRFPPMGYKPASAYAEILFSLGRWAETVKDAEVFSATFAYVVPTLPSGRESFSPDASLVFGPYKVTAHDFIEGPPAFAVEVRVKGDFGAAAERAMAAKRDDYFQAGTLVVWDVDPVAEVVRRYRPNESQPTVFQRGEVADAEPAVPGWTMSVDDVFA